MDVNNEQTTDPSGKTRLDTQCNGQEIVQEIVDSNDDHEEPPSKLARLSYGEFSPKRPDAEDSPPGPSVADLKVVTENSYSSPYLSNDTPEKMGMHEFEIIDEVAADDEDPDEDGEQDSDESLDDSELYALLEEGITKDSIVHSERPIEREKVVLVERGHDPFDILPEGWLVVTHNSGMPVYLHRQSRVCTLAKPYFLGSGSARKHDIPISAVPCLMYRRQLDKERPTEEEGGSQPGEAGNGDASSTAVPEQGVNTPAEEAGSKSDPTAGEDSGTQSVQATTADTASKTEQTSEHAASKTEQTPDSSDSKTDQTTAENTDSQSEQTAVEQTTNADAGSKTEQTTAEGANSQPEQASGDAGSRAEQTTAEGANSQPEQASGDAGSRAEQTTAESSGSKTDATSAFPSVKIKSADEMRRETSVDFLKLREYCQNLFEFKTVTVQRYKTWRDRRKHMGAKKQSRPELPPSTKLITCSVPMMSPDKKKTKGKEFFLNPSGKSFVCILHEYVQHTMKVQPFYVFKELENSKTPYSATVMINDLEYGTGCAISKKQAKSEAAKNTLKILIPEMNSLTDDQLQKNSEDLSFFDEIKIEDPRISELGNKAGQPSPYQILRECLSRNYGMGDTDCLLDMKPLKHQNCEFTITVGKHKATVIAKSKRSGKQRAAQAILQKLHPHVPSWGSLLRLYGNTADRAQCAKRTEVNEVKRHRPNQAILDRLREEMRKLSAQRDAIKSHGRLVVSSEDLPNKVNSVDL